MTEHTPGRWRAIAMGSEGYTIITGDPDRAKHRRKVADVRSGEWDELRANARLIAAAPDLLEACLFGATNVLGGGHGLLREAAKLLADSGIPYQREIAAELRRKAERQEAAIARAKGQA